MARRIYSSIAFWGLTIVVLAGLALGGFALHTQRLAALADTPPPERFPWALRTAVVAKSDLTDGFPVLATLKSRSEIAIIPQISGAILEMGPREGQPVAKGDMLVRIDTREMENELAALLASRRAAAEQVSLSSKELERQEKLLTKGFAPQERVDTLRTALETNRQKVNQLTAQIEALKTRLEYGIILAPGDGVISARLQEPGDLAAPGRPIYRMTSAAGAEMRITVPQAIAEQLRTGSEVRLDHGSDHETVAISRIFPALDALSMGSAEADLDSIPFGLSSGARVPGRVVLKKWDGVFVVPRTALVLGADGRKATVFRIAPGKGDGLARVERVAVSILGSGREGIAIQGPVAAGDRVAIAQETDLLRLKDGDPVQPEPGVGS